MNPSFAKKNKKYPGFTFLEIMMVIAISGILMTISTISYNLTRRSAVISASVEEVSSALKMTKGYALQGKMPNPGSSVCGAGSICGYGFRFISATQYQVFYYYACSGGNLDCSNPATTTKVAIDTQNLKNGATLSSPLPANSTAYFSIPWGLLESTSGGQTYTISHSGSSKNVTIDANGVIQ